MHLYTWYCLFLVLFILTVFCVSNGYACISLLHFLYIYIFNQHIFLYSCVSWLHALLIATVSFIIITCLKGVCCGPTVHCKPRRSWRCLCWRRWTRQGRSCPREWKTLTRRWRMIRQLWLTMPTTSSSTIKRERWVCAAGGGGEWVSVRVGLSSEF